MNDQPIFFQEHPIEILPEDLFQKVDNQFRPTDLCNKEEFKYDVTVLDIFFCKEEIKSDFTIGDIFSQEVYQAALLHKLGSFPKSVQRDFLRYQIDALSNPREWLQELEQLVETNLRVSPLDGKHMHWERVIKHVPELIEKCIADIEAQITHPTLEALKTKFSVEELAILFRGMVEAGLIEVPKPKTKLFKWISHSFSTKGKLNPSEIYIKNSFNNPPSAAVKSVHKKLISLADKIYKDL